MGNARIAALKGIDHGESADALHGAAVGEAQERFVIVQRAVRRGRGLSGREGRRRRGVAGHDDLIFCGGSLGGGLAGDFMQQLHGALVKRLHLAVRQQAVLDLGNLILKEIDALQHEADDGLPNIHGDVRVLPERREHILHAVRQLGQPFVAHHGGGTLDGVHDAENLVDVGLFQYALLFAVKQHFLQLLQKLGVLINIDIGQRISGTHAKYSPSKTA